MTWATLIAILFLSRGAEPDAVIHDFKQLERAVKQTVSEKQRRNTVIEVIRSAEKRDAQTLQRAAQLEQAVADMIAQHSTDSQQLQATMEELQSVREFRQQEMLDVRFAVRDYLSPEEWAMVFGIGSRSN
jgi:hypothetical protein